MLEIDFVSVILGSFIGGIIGNLFAALIHQQILKYQNRNHM